MSVMDLRYFGLLLFLQFTPLVVQVLHVYLILVLLTPLQQLFQNLQAQFLQSWGVDYRVLLSQIGSSI